MKSTAFVHTTEGFQEKTIVLKRPVGREESATLYVAKTSDGMFLTGGKWSGSGVNCDGDFEFFQSTEYQCRSIVEGHIKANMINMLHITKEDSPIF